MSDKSMIVGVTILISNNIIPQLYQKS